MQIEIGASEQPRKSQKDIRFRELPYSIETGEAEMISTSFVARGGGNATVEGVQASHGKQSAAAGEGKAPAVDELATMLSADEEDSQFSFSFPFGAPSYCDLFWQVPV